MNYFFTSESVSEGHPDKVADQISDSILDEFLAQDPKSKVACETLVTTGLVVVAGEVKSKAYVDVQSVVRKVVNGIGYTKGEYRFDGNSCGVMSAIHEQSPDINQGVEKGKGLHTEQGAGDQGMMFGYACKDTDTYMPLPLDLAHRMLKKLSEIRREGKEMTYLRPDAKSQITIEYDENGNPLRIDTIVISTQHDEFDKNETKMLKKIENDVTKILIPKVKAELPERTQKLFKNDFKLFVNPTGKFVIGGPHGDSGLTGRKIIVDTYGGKGAHGGGAFSGKDPSKVDRSAAYMARYAAKSMVANHFAKEITIQISYAIGVSRPISIYVNAKGSRYTNEQLAEIIKKNFDFSPYGIITTLNLKHPIYFNTATYGHFGHVNCGYGDREVSPWENWKKDVIA